MLAVSCTIDSIYSPYLGLETLVILVELSVYRRKAIQTMLIREVSVSIQMVPQVIGMHIFLLRSVTLAD